MCGISKQKDLCISICPSLVSRKLAHHVLQHVLCLRLKIRSGYISFWESFLNQYTRNITSTATILTLLVIMTTKIFLSLLFKYRPELWIEQAALRGPEAPLGQQLAVQMTTLCPRRTPGLQPKCPGTWRSPSSPKALECLVSVGTANHTPWKKYNNHNSNNHTTVEY